MKYCYLLLWFIYSLDVSNGAFRMTPVIEMSQGKIRGLETQRGDFRKYLGIPYATFMGRFQEPGPSPQWSTTLNATANKVYCAQYSSRMRIPIGDEDCLTLNVFTPGQHSHKKLLPVMVYIHGGGYMDGNANDLFYNPEPLVKKNVIVVVINYRLGAFGFLCLRIKGASGNAGLKDQIAALKWVNQNIRAFGGDPQSVTVFGQNAGSASVGHLILSRDAKGLFHKAIMESGTALSPLAFAYNPIERAAVVASNLGYSTKNPYELLKAFTNATKAEITMASVVDKDNSLNPLSQYIFRPCAEKLIPGIKPFMTKSPKQTLESGNYNKVPVIIGYNDKDGMEYAAKFDYSQFERLLDNLEEILPDNLILGSDAKAKAAEIVKQFYFIDKLPSQRFPTHLIDYFSDTTTEYSSKIFAEYLVQSSRYPVFTYYFQYDSRRSAVKPIITDKRFTNGAAGSDELLYLFQPVVTWTLSMNKKDAMMVDRMTMMWTNFAKIGDPTFTRSSLVPVKWLPSDNETMQYLFIDEALRMTGLPNPSRLDLWRFIYGADWGLVLD